MANHSFSSDAFLIEAVTSKLPDHLSIVIENLHFERNLYSQNAKDLCLLVSAENGSRVLLQALLEAGANLECRDAKGNTPLMISVINNQLGSTHLFLSRGAQVNAVNNSGDTALILSTYFTATHTATRLLLQTTGINIEHRNVNGFNALECATQAINVEAMYLLIQANAHCQLVPLDGLNVQSTNHSTNHSTNNSMNHTTNLMTNHTTNHSMNHLTNHSTNHSMNHTTNFLTNHTTYHSMNHSMNHSTNHIMNPTMNPPQSTLLSCARKNATLNLIRYFKIEKDNGQLALSLAIEQRDLRSAKYILSMDNSVLNYSCHTYLMAVINFIKSVKHLILTNLEFSIFKSLVTNYIMLRKAPTNKTLENGAVKMALTLGHTAFILVLCVKKFFISNEVVGDVAVTGNIFLLGHLVKHGGTVNKADEAGRCLYQGSPLERALRSERFECADLLLHSGAFIDISLALKLAVDCNSEKCFEFLFGKFPRETSHELTSSKILHVAVFQRKVDIINKILEKGVSVNMVYEDYTPLMSAIDSDVMSLLVSKGADVNKVTGSNITFRSILHHFVSIKYKELLKTKFTGVGDASMNIFHAALIKQLIHHGARIDSRDSLERTPLMLAAETGDSSKIIEVLLEAGAQINQHSFNGDTALHRAVRCGLESNVECLLQSGADINARSANGQSALFMCDSDDLLNLLLENDADVDVEDHKGNTALLHYLMKWDVNEDIIESLIEADSDVNHENKAGRTPLLLAAKMFKPHIVTALVASGADVNYSITVGDREVSAVTILMKRLRQNRLNVKDCLTTLLNNGLTPETIPPSIIHALISVSLFSLVTRFISLGIPPTVIEIHGPVNAWIKAKYCITPLEAAILVNNCQLAQYLVDIRYLTSRDLQTFSENKEMVEYLLGEGCQNIVTFLKKYSRQPFSLETLSFIAVSEAFGDDPERSDAIKSCLLPLPLQDALLFKKVSRDMTDTVMSNRFLLRSSLQQARLCSLYDLYADMNNEYSSEYDTMSDDD
ncbi:ankyrin-2 [Biomphalaria glabrata]|nr:ankyrin-2 [Biomphalaria glabrata]